MNSIFKKSCSLFSIVINTDDNFVSCSSCSDSYTLNVCIIWFPQRNANQEHQLFVAYLIYQIAYNCDKSLWTPANSKTDSKYVDLQNNISTLFNVWADISLSLS